MESRLPLSMSRFHVVCESCNLEVENLGCSGFFPHFVALSPRYGHGRVCVTGLRLDNQAGIIKRHLGLWKHPFAIFGCRVMVCPSCLSYLLTQCQTMCLPVYRAFFVRVSIPSGLAHLLSLLLLVQIRWSVLDHHLLIKG